MKNFLVTVMVGNKLVYEVQAVNADGNGNTIGRLNSLGAICRKSFP